MVDFLIQALTGSAIVMALLVLISGPLSRRAGPGLAYALWGLVAVRLMLPPLRFDWWQILPASLRPEAAVATGNPLIVEQMSWFDRYGMIMIACWLAGAATLFLIGMASSLHFQRRLARDARRFGQLGRIGLFLSPVAEGPVATGLVHRRIYLPLDFASRWSEEEAAMILAHERVHHERGDLWANLLGFIILSLHWFNPVAWLAWQRFRVDQECACDARVLARRSAGERASYGQALLKASGRETQPALTLALITPHTIVERIEMMRNLENGRSWPTMIGLAGLALVAVPATAATQAKPDHAKVEKVIVLKGDGGSDKVHTVTFIGEDGKEQTIDVKGEWTAKEGDGEETNVFVIDSKQAADVKQVWVEKKGDGETFEITVKPCDSDNKDECK